jgi:hypothetical protein
MSFVSPQAQQEPQEDMQEKISNILFGNPTNIFYLYNKIKECLETKEFTNDICVVDNDEKNTRITSKCKDNYSTDIKYDMNHLALYGGSAYRMIIYYIENKYNIHGFNMPIIDKKNYLVNDIDLIWWPFISRKDNELFIYHYPDLSNFYDKIEKNIQDTFDKDKHKYIMLLNNNNINVNNNTFNIKVNKSDDLLRGLVVISISFIIDNKPYRIIEFTIHDGASSQSEKDKNGKIIFPLRPMETDPTYISNLFGILKQNSPEYVMTPYIEEFVKQQIFAYDNLKDKGESTRSKTTNIILRLITLRKLLIPLIQIIENNIFYKKPHSQELILKNGYYEESVTFFNIKQSIFLIDNFINKIQQYPQQPQYQYPQQPQIFSHHPQSQSQYSQQQPQSQYMSHIPPPLPPPLPPQPPLPRYRGGKTKKKGHQLFNDNPRGRPRTKGIGYGTAKKAKNSITRLKGKSKTYKRQIATTMYYRAKHHKYQNKGMRNAMKVWKKYLNKL